MPLEFDKTLPYVRAYFNHRNAAPLIWSVDDGDQTNEINVARIISEGIGIWKHNGGLRNEKAPVAWVEYPQARCWMVDDLLVISNSE